MKTCPTLSVTVFTAWLADRICQAHNRATAELIERARSLLQPPTASLPIMTILRSYDAWKRMGNYVCIAPSLSIYIYSRGTVQSATIDGRNKNGVLQHTSVLNGSVATKSIWTAHMQSASSVTGTPGVNPQSEPLDINQTASQQVREGRKRDISIQLRVPEDCSVQDALTRKSGPPCISPTIQVIQLLRMFNINQSQWFPGFRTNGSRRKAPTHP